ncbi:MAG: hypothetical protein R2912_13015 [Eubacteriales bacterium]
MKEFCRVQHPVAGLLLTLFVIIFSFQGRSWLSKIRCIVLIAIPLAN